MNYLVINNKYNILGMHRMFLLFLAEQFRLPNIRCIPKINKRKDRINCTEQWRDAIK